MSFIQIIEFTSSHEAEIIAMNAEWEAATEGRRTARRSISTRDRNDPTRFHIIVFFDSAESAAENSNLPETSAFAERLAALLDGPPTFHDLDVIEDRS
jgi:quinol monooxygenase YgiN